MRKLIKDYGTRLMVWGLLAQGTYRIFTNETLKNIGAKYGKTSTQVVLNFLTGEGIVAIPKSVHTLRMTENLDIESFELTETDWKMIRKLDTGLLKVDFNDPARGSKLNCVIVLFFLLASKISFHIEFIFRYLSESKIMVYLID